MKKNVASQKIGAQMVSATDGSAFTGSVTVSVTGDAGIQATGSVGSGACTHEGNGYHTYAPAQAETNYDLIAFTFTGTGAVPATVQVYTVPTTGLLAPTVADRTLAVTATGAAGIDWSNVENPTSTVSFTNTTVATVTTTTTATNVTTVNGLAANVLTAAATASDFGTEVGTAVWASATRTLTSLSGLTVDTVTTLTNLPAITANWLTAAGTASDFGTEIGAAVLSALGTGTWATAIPWNASWDAEVQSEVQDALDATVADSVPADGTRPSVSSGIYMITQALVECSISGTTMTVKKPDGSTTLFTVTLNDGTTPTAKTRAS